MTDLLAAVSAVVASITASLIFLYLTVKYWNNHEKRLVYLGLFLAVSAMQQWRPLS